MRWIVALILLFCKGASGSPPGPNYWEIFGPPVSSTPPTEMSIVWQLMYRGYPLHAAFAYAVHPNDRYSWNAVGGYASPEAAEAAALQACRSQVVEEGVVCVTLAVDGGRVGHPPLVLADGSFGEATRSRLHHVFGPEKARGVVIWSHGYGGTATDGRVSAIPGWISALNDAGWDIMRFDRAPETDLDINSVVERLLRAVGLVREHGYRRVVLAGVSRGGWQSLLAASHPEASIHAVIATVPGAHGSHQNAEFRHATAIGDWRRVLNGLSGSMTRVAMVFFLDDPFNPSQDTRARLWSEWAEARPYPSLLIRPSHPSGHDAEFLPGFIHRWTNCLLNFVEDADPPAGAVSDGCF